MVADDASGKISRERLNQIAAKKLDSLGVSVQSGPDGRLEGELIFSSGTPVQKARFFVHGHDCVKFVDPPLAALGPVAFFDAEHLGAFEMHVTRSLQQMLGTLQPVNSPLALTVAHLARLGEGLEVRAGGLELSQTFELGGVRYRFEAQHISGSSFKGRVVGPAGTRWADTFDAVRFPGAAAVVASALSVKPTPHAPEIPHEAVPHTGETWVMNVIVEKEDGQEVRYVCTNVDGKPYGATRILRRSDFQNLFVQQKGTWRLLINIDECRGDNVIYRQLDRTGHPRGSAKSMPLSVLTTTFVPESAPH